MADGREIHVYDSNYWLCTITIDENVKGNHPNEAAPLPQLQNRTPIESGFVFSRKLSGCIRMVTLLLLFRNESG